MKERREGQREREKDGEAGIRGPDTRARTHVRAKARSARARRKEGAERGGERRGEKRGETKRETVERELVVRRGATSQSSSGDGESEVARACGYP